MLTLTYEYKILPSEEQIAIIEQYLETCRKVWNYSLRERKDWINSRKCQVNACSITSEYIIPVDAPYPGYQHQAKQLTAARQNNEDLKQVNAQVLQQVLIRLDDAFIEMRERGLGFPRFKKPGRMKSFVFPQFKGNPIQKDWIKLPVGSVKMILSRPIPEGFVLKQVRVVKKALLYFALLALQTDVNVPDIQPHGHPMGIDLGLEKFAATSDGELIARPKFFSKLQRKLKLLQRRLKKKEKGSKNCAELRQKIARLHQQINDTRKDWHDPNGTSQTCPICNAHTPKTLSIRVHNCHECGYTTDRDVAAAQVVLIRGVESIAAPSAVSSNQNVCGDGLAGTPSTVKSRRSRKSKAAKS